jgi:hypothetical protein
VKVWDVAAQACQHTLRHHSGKVQAVAWNPAEPPVLLSGGFDQRACLVRPRRWLVLRQWLFCLHAAPVAAFVGAGVILC